MTPELLAQRRWQRIAGLINATGGLQADNMPLSEGGGILIIYQHRAFHFYNVKAAVNVDISVADTGKLIEGRWNCCRFDQPLLETGQAVCEQIASGLSLEDLT